MQSGEARIMSHFAERFNPGIQESNMKLTRLASLIAVLFVIGFSLPSGNRGIASTLNPPRGRANYGLDFWREAEGLPQSRIRSIVQTRDGYLWLGTDSGLVRFNGTSFTTF